MVMILAAALSIIFVILGSFHFYWFLGGTWGLDKVIPTKDVSMKTISIPKLATLMVGIVFVLFSLIYLERSGLIAVPFPKWISEYGIMFIPILFILRAIGEFKYVGFFKKIRNTEFAKADTKIFSPLCLGIGLIGVLILL